MVRWMGWLVAFLGVGRAVEGAWTAVCALPVLLFWVLTLPVWGPFWCAKVVGAWVWSASGALVWTAVAGLRRGALGVNLAETRMW
ncbi:uncharacterized protein C8Q71DRAFT_774147 [Rhodofomes roseus]|uniref:Uncharacterized protein n=1 Tax=Rhodofomes roseus TaxID=34475 RepID=A0ABQ8K8T6_9APHY|nr:uncharacterized protein C8Q71DRAFT_774147 [Rhodofomes roseus]KAH9833608.1 hypothetical protein C8Q71DRAFT_774147 [Rhodofomes roseus]